MTFAQPSPGAARTLTIRGHLDLGADDFVYLPVDVPSGANRIDVSYSYDPPAAADDALANSCDIGVFDERGIELGGRGFRGWSGGSRTEFTISAGDATPGYLPGAIGAGRWHVVLAPYRIAPQGMTYEVRVTIAFGEPPAPFVPHYPPQSPGGRPRGWYRGDCHLHTVYSDGDRTPAEVGAAARAARLDFIVTTDHNTPSSHGAWGPVAGDDLLVITGEEVTTRAGHYLALGIPPGEWVDWRYRAHDHELDRFAHDVRRLGGIVVPAHPYRECLGCLWEFGYGAADAVEVWNGRWTATDESAVTTWDSMLVDAARDGSKWLPAIGNSDAHREPQVIGLPQTVVLADELSRDSLLDAIASGRSWLAESADVHLDFTVTGEGRTAVPGERLVVHTQQPVRATAVVRGVPDAVVRFLTSDGQVQQTSLGPDGSGSASWLGTPSPAAYVRVEVRHPQTDSSSGESATAESEQTLSPMAAMSNPIFLGQ